MRQEKKKNSDTRIKKRNFSWLHFLVLFIVMITLALSQSVIITNYYQADEIPSELIGSIIHYWLIVAVLFTLAISLFIRVTYEKPMEKISDAARKVAKGDFSVTLTPRHKAEELDQLDVMFLDFNKMVDELKGGGKSSGPVLCPMYPMSSKHRFPLSGIMLLCWKKGISASCRGRNIWILSSRQQISLESWYRIY